MPVSSTTQDGSTTTTLTLTTDPDDPEVKPTIITTPDEVEDDELPFTGIDSDLMIGLAILLSGVGAALLALTRRVEDN